MPEKYKTLEELLIFLQTKTSDIPAFEAITLQDDYLDPTQFNQNIHYIETYLNILYEKCRTLEAAESIIQEIFYQEAKDLYDEIQELLQKIESQASGLLEKDYIPIDIPFRYNSNMAIDKGAELPTISIKDGVLFAGHHRSDAATVSLFTRKSSTPSLSNNIKEQDIATYYSCYQGQMDSVTEELTFHFATPIWLNFSEVSINNGKVLSIDWVLTNGNTVRTENYSKSETLYEVEKVVIQYQSKNVVQIFNEELYGPQKLIPDMWYQPERFPVRTLPIDTTIEEVDRELEGQRKIGEYDAYLRELELLRKQKELKTITVMPPNYEKR